MDDRSREDHEPTHVQVVLDHIRPTVVVRRRAGETVQSQTQPEPHHPVTVAIALDHEPRTSESADEPDAPAAPARRVVAEIEPARMPGKVALPEALSEEVTHEEAVFEKLPEKPASPVRPPKRVPVGSSIPLTKLAAAMKLAPGEVASELVTRGFFEVTPKSTLSREIARVAAAAFGWQVKEVADPKVAVLSGRRKPARTPKRNAKAARGPSRKTTKPRKGAPTRRRPSSSRRAA